MHQHQITVTPGMVRDLVATQFPEWADLPVTRVTAEGTANAVFRLGSGLTARFPLQPADVTTTRQRLAAEAAAADELLAHTRFPVPQPMAIGEPGAGYPLPWSVYTWLPGTTASQEDVSTSTAFADDLAVFITEVRSIDVAGRVFTGEGRGGDLKAHDQWMETCFERSGELLDVPRLRRMWQRLRSLPRESPDVMTHGDLVPGNVLVSGGRFSGVLDVGGLGAADPALDLVAAWHLLETGPRRRFRQQVGSDDLEWERGKAWAFQQAMGLVWYYRLSNESMSRTGRTTLTRLLAEESDG